MERRAASQLDENDEWIGELSQLQQKILVELNHRPNDDLKNKPRKRGNHSVISMTRESSTQRIREDPVTTHKEKPYQKSIIHPVKTSLSSANSTGFKGRSKKCLVRKEGMADNNSDIQRRINLLTEENIQLKVLLRHSEEELLRKNKLIQEMATQMSYNNSYTLKEGSMIGKLKSQVKELKYENGLLQEELKSDKFEKKNPLYDQKLLFLEEECGRLRSLIEKQKEPHKLHVHWESQIPDLTEKISDIEERNPLMGTTPLSHDFIKLNEDLSQESVFKNGRKIKRANTKNSPTCQTICELKEKCNKLEIENKDKEKQIETLNNQIISLEETIEKQKTEIIKFETENISLRENALSNPGTGQMAKQIENLTSQKMAHEKIIKKLRQELASLKKKDRECEYYKVENERLRGEIINFQSASPSSELLLQEIKAIKSATEEVKAQMLHTTKFSVSQDTENFSQCHQVVKSAEEALPRYISLHNEIVEIKKEIVKEEDIQPSIKHLTQLFASQSFTHEKLKNILNKFGTERISIKQLINCLQEDFGFIKDEFQAEYLSRYLIEPRDNPFIIYSEERDIKVVNLLENLLYIIPPTCLASSDQKNQLAQASENLLEIDLQSSQQTEMVHLPSLLPLRDINEEIMNIVKEKDTTFANLIDTKVRIGTKGSGDEFEIILVHDLEEILQEVCGLNKPQTEAFIAQQNPQNEEYVALSQLLPSLGEEYISLITKNPIDNLLEGVEDLDSGALTLFAQLAKYLQLTKNTFEEVFHSYIYKQSVVIEDKESEIDVIDASSFNTMLRYLKLLKSEISPIPNAFLCVDENYPDILYVSRILHLINYINLHSVNQGDLQF